MLTYAAKTVVQILKRASVDDELSKGYQNDLDIRWSGERCVPQWERFQGCKVPAACSSLGMFLKQDRKHLW